MRFVLLLILGLSLVSCGKKSDSDEGNTVSTLPAISVDEEQENVETNNDFSATANKTEYELDEIIMVQVKNLSSNTMNHFGFNFSADTEELLVSRINCFEALSYNDQCSFVIRFKNPKPGFHKIKVHYEAIHLQLTVLLKDGEVPTPIDFLYLNHHTYNDCYNAFKKGKNGFVKQSGGRAFCNFRAQHWDSPEKVQIETDPLNAMIDPSIDANDHYCPSGWTVNSFEFSAAIVEEHTNFWGGRKDVTIPPGESKEVCVRRNLFGCRERRKFYSRLSKVNCY